MVKGDEKTSKEIMIFKAPPSEFFPNHPHESKAGGHPLQKRAIKARGKRGE